VAGGWAPATPKECVGLELAAVWAAEHIEERVRDHYQNRPNAHLAYMKLRRQRGVWPGKTAVRPIRNQRLQPSTGVKRRLRRL
jgi:hypothetical protein